MVCFAPRLDYPLRLNLRLDLLNLRIDLLNLRLDLLNLRLDLLNLRLDSTRIRPSPRRVLSSLIYDSGTPGPLRGARGVEWSASGLIPGRVLSSLIYDSGTLGPLRGAQGVEWSASGLGRLMCICRFPRRFANHGEPAVISKNAQDSIKDLIRGARASGDQRRG